jgi:hypothetical protein
MELRPVALRYLVKVENACRRRETTDGKFLEVRASQNEHVPETWRNRFQVRKYF